MSGGDALAWTLFALGGYLLGAVPFGLLLGRLRGVDLRAHGSGNIGATNALRVLGKPLGAACFVLDVAKGAGPVLASGAVMGVLGRGDASPAQTGAWLAVGVAAVLGHVFPVYLRFKGGKGVATGFGTFAAYWPWVTAAALAALVVWVVVLRLTRYVSASSVAAAIALPLGILAGQLAGWPAGAGPRDAAGGWAFLAAGVLLGGVVVLRHRDNLRRLRAGTEPKIGATRPAGPDRAA